MIEIKPIKYKGEKIYPQTHWDAVTGARYANVYDENEILRDGIITASDKEKIDNIIKEQGIVLASPDGSQFLITVNDEGELSTVPYFNGGIDNDES